MRWISDPGHAWLEVSYAELANAGAAIDDFSNCSYLNQTRNLIYLEEDCDAPKFIARLPYAVRKAIKDLPDLHIKSTQPHSNFVRRCPRLGEVRYGRFSPSSAQQVGR